MCLQLRSKVWVELEGKKVFGDGPWELLHLVDEKGSLRQAAQEMKMSYHQAWQIINMIETNPGLLLLRRKAGGPGGGGSALTEEGKLLVKEYHQFRYEANSKLEELFLLYVRSLREMTPGNQ